jgi:hypothetical protein
MPYISSINGQLYVIHSPRQAEALRKLVLQFQPVEAVPHTHDELTLFVCKDESSYVPQVVIRIEAEQFVPAA